MLKKLLAYLILCFFIGSLSANVFAQSDGTITRLDQWSATTSPNAITQRVFGKPLKLTGLNTGECLTLSSNGLATTTGSACGGGSGNSAWTIGNGVIYNATTTDNVGIGLNNPSAQLHIGKSSGLNSAIYIDSTMASNVEVSLAYRNSNSAWSTGMAGSGSDYIIANYPQSVSTSEALVITNSTRRVGIGTSTPATRLQITGSSGVNPFRIASSTNLSMFEVTQAGNVGIGTSTPTSKLQALSTGEQFRLNYDHANYWNSTTNNSGLTTFNAVGSGSAFGFSDVILGENGTATAPMYSFTNYSNFGLYMIGTGQMGLTANGSNAIFIDGTTNNNIGIGTTPSAKLHTLSTTEQFRSGYNASNYWNATTGSTGTTTFDAVGTSPTFYFKDDVKIGTTPNDVLTRLGKLAVVGDTNSQLTDADNIINACAQNLTQCFAMRYNGLYATGSNSSVVMNLESKGANITFNGVAETNAGTPKFSIGGGYGYFDQLRLGGGDPNTIYSYSGQQIGIVTAPNLYGISIAATNGRLSSFSTSAADGSLNYNFYLQDKTAFAAGVGGGIGFVGDYQTGVPGMFSGIQGFKENGTSGNYAGALGFYTRINSGSLTERMRVKSSGEVVLGALTSGNWFAPQDDVTVNTGGNAGITWATGEPTNYGIYRSSGAWSGNFAQGVFKWRTGLIIDGGYEFGLSGLQLQPNGGNVSIATSTLNARLTVAEGDVYVASSTRGIILRSPDGTCARGTISDIDVLTFASVTCPS